jgi:RNA polymerase-binding transcription factor DksA
MTGGRRTRESEKGGNVAREKRFCARCKAEIPEERVEALPETRVCIKCAEAMGGSEFDVVAVPNRGGKKESIKRLVTDYEVRKRRKPITPIEE